jgi:hypothetical protein
LIGPLMIPAWKPELASPNDAMITASEWMVFDGGTMRRADLGDMNALSSAPSLQPPSIGQTCQKVGAILPPGIAILPPNAILPSSPLIVSEVRRCLSKGFHWSVLCGVFSVSNI